MGVIIVPTTLNQLICLIVNPPVGFGRTYYLVDNQGKRPEAGLPRSSLLCQSSRLPEMSTIIFTSLYPYGGNVLLTELYPYPRKDIVLANNLEEVGLFN